MGSVGIGIAVNSLEHLETFEWALMNKNNSRSKSKEKSCLRIRDGLIKLYIDELWLS